MQLYLLSVEVSVESLLKNEKIATCNIVMVILLVYGVLTTLFSFGPTV